MSKDLRAPVAALQRQGFTMQRGTKEQDLGDAAVTDETFEPGFAQAAAQRVIDCAARSLRQVAALRAGELPGLIEACEDHVLVTFARSERGRLGSFWPNEWRHGQTLLSEIRLNMDRRQGHDDALPGEDALVTLIHELVHAYNFACGIKDCSRDGRYHNRRFGEPAVQVGLRIERSQHGVSTPGLQPWARDEYADLIDDLDRALRLEPNLPRPDGDSSTSAAASGTATDPSSPATASSKKPKFVFATCRCASGRRARRIRVAVGRWEPGSILCRLCGSPFTPPAPSGTVPDDEDEAASEEVMPINSETA